MGKGVSYGAVELVPAESPKAAWDKDHLCVVVTYPCGCVNKIPVLSDGGLYPNSSVYTSCREAWCAFGWDDAEQHAREFLNVIGKVKLLRGADDSE